MDYQVLIEKAEARLNKDAEVHKDSAEAYALLAIAYELHRMNNNNVNPMMKR